MKVLILIPARSGSKRLPKKNTIELGGKPLIQWTFDIAKNISCASDILVSTDDLEIYELAKSANLMVPWLRPSELATDTTSSFSVAIHALDWYEINYGKIDGLLLLQPTSPFRDISTINRAIDIFRENKEYPIVSVNQVSTSPYWMFYEKNQNSNVIQPLFSPKYFKIRSQDLPKCYVANGSLYLISPKLLRRHKTFVTNNIIPVEVFSKSECIDIDTYEDYIQACEMVKNFHD